MSAHKTKAILQEVLPIVVMIGLIPVITDDIVLTGAYIVISILGFKLRKEKHDLLVYSLGFFCMFFSETLFIATGVETFQRNSLFGIMPLWLPFLWAYGFVVIRRAIHIIEQ